MWILRWVILLLIIVTVLTFSLQNQEGVVDLKFLKWESGPIPLYLALFISFGLGMVAFLLIAAFQQLQTLTELSKMRKNFKKLQKELEDVHKEIDTHKTTISDNEEEKARLRHNAEVLQNKLDTAAAKAQFPGDDSEEEKD